MEPELSSTACALKDMLEQIARPDGAQQLAQGAGGFYQNEVSLVDDLHQAAREVPVLVGLDEFSGLRKPFTAGTAHADSVSYRRYARGAYAESMPLPARDAELVQIMDAELAQAARMAGDWLACRPGCTQCCHGVFAISVLDAARLSAGMNALRQSDPERAGRVDERARDWLAEHGAAFPGDAATGILGASEREREAFEEFANEAACPALDPATGLCDVYDFRPMTCRVFGPPVRVEVEEAGGGALGCCELCFVGATEEEIAACEIYPPHALEAELVAELSSEAETVVAFALAAAR